MRSCRPGVELLLLLFFIILDDKFLRRLPEGQLNALVPAAATLLRRNAREATARAVRPPSR